MLGTWTSTEKEKNGSAATCNAMLEPPRAVVSRPSRNVADPPQTSSEAHVATGMMSNESMWNRPLSLHTLRSFEISP